MREKEEQEKGNGDHSNNGGKEDGEGSGENGTKTTATMAVGGAVAGLGPRQQRAKAEGLRDREVMAFMARFRFVTVASLAERFDVSERRMRQRVRRLEGAGLVKRPRTHSAPGGLYLTRRGTDQLGLPPRRPPSVDVHRRHELAIVAEVIRLERAAGIGARILTERECRRLEADKVGTFHVRARGDSGRMLERWPDLVMVTRRERIAVELEFTSKHVERTRRIVRAYLDSDAFDRVVYVVDSPPLARQLLRLAAQQRAEQLRLLNDLALPSGARARHWTVYRKCVPVTLRLDDAPVKSSTQFTSASAQVLVLTTAIPDERAPITLHSVYVGQRGDRTHATHLVLARGQDEAEPVTREHDAGAMPVADDDRHPCLYDHLQQLLDALHRAGHDAHVDVVDAAIAMIDA